MNILVIDHHFAQDIDSFLYSGREHRFWPVSCRYFTSIAESIFPKPVFHGLNAYFRPEYAGHREEYASRVRARVQELYSVFEFDIVLAPSDIFFWIRAVIDAVHELGIPFVVLQKEALVTEAIMDEPARELAELFPFAGDWMFVSSEFARRFWINAGTPPELVSVTGQPRFDFYRQPERWVSWKELGLDLDPTRRNVVFFTYDSNAFLPVWDRDGLAPWLELRNETEEALVKLARDEKYNVIIKAHPQPGEDQTEHVETLAKNPHVYAIDSQANTRQLVVNANVVVGYLSTAMFEAMVARKETIYTYWTRPVLEAGESTTPFHRMGDALHIAHSAHEMIDLIRAAGRVTLDDAAVAARDRIFADYLGSLDGHATERCLAKMGELAAEFEARTAPDVRARRREIRAGAAERCRRALPRAFVSAVVWKLIKGFLLPLYPSWTFFRRGLWWKRTPPTPRHVYQQFVLERNSVANEWLRQCFDVSRNK